MQVGRQREPCRAPMSLVSSAAQLTRARCTVCGVKTVLEARDRRVMAMTLGRTELAANPTKVKTFDSEDAPRRCGEQSVWSFSSLQTSRSLRMAREASCFILRWNQHSQVHFGRQSCQPPESGFISDSSKRYRDHQEHHAYACPHQLELSLETEMLMKLLQPS